MRAIRDRSSESRLRPCHHRGDELIVFLGVAEPIDRPEKLTVSALIRLDAAEEVHDLRWQGQMGPVPFENVLDPSRVFSERKIGALWVDLSARNRSAVADLIEARPKVVHRIEEDARRACRRELVKSILVNEVWGLALGVDQVGPRVFVGELIDDLFEIVDVMLGAFKSEPWAVEGSDACHRFPRFAGVVSFASRKITSL